MKTHHYDIQTSNLADYKRVRALMKKVAEPSTLRVAHQIWEHPDGRPYSEAAGIYLEVKGRKGIRGSKRNGRLPNHHWLRLEGTSAIVAESTGDDPIRFIRCDTLQQLRPKTKEQKAHLLMLTIGDEANAKSADSMAHLLEAKGWKELD